MVPRGLRAAQTASEGQAGPRANLPETALQAETAQLSRPVPGAPRGAGLLGKDSNAGKHGREQESTRGTDSVEEAVGTRRAEQGLMTGHCTPPTHRVAGVGADSTSRHTHLLTNGHRTNALLCLLWGQTGARERALCGLLLPFPQAPGPGLCRPRDREATARRKRTDMTSGALDFWECSSCSCYRVFKGNFDFSNFLQATGLKNSHRKSRGYRIKPQAAVPWRGDLPRRELRRWMAGAQPSAWHRCH